MGGVGEIQRRYLVRRAAVLEVAQQAGEQRGPQQLLRRLGG